jgi:serine/threonine protein kinase
VGAKLGEGNFGEVYLVKNAKTNQRKVMKCVKIKGDGKALEGELKVGLEIASDCPFLVPVEELFKELNHHCLIMELCKDDLESILKKANKLPELVFNFSFFFFYVIFLIGNYQDCIMCDLWIKKTS